MRIEEFLLARVGEDEAVARQAAPGPWTVGEDGDIDGQPTPPFREWDVESIVITDNGAYPPNAVTAGHIVRWAPPRVLAECEAKRAVVAAAADARAAAESIRETFDGHDDERAKVERAGYSQAQHAWYQAVAILAAAYDSHPDYDPAWRP